jgi:hypothetical protein
VANFDVDEFQKQTRELLRAQQDAYLAAVKAWQEAAAAAAASGLQPPQQPMPWMLSCPQFRATRMR